MEGMKLENIYWAHPQRKDRDEKSTRKDGIFSLSQAFDKEKIALFTVNLFHLHYNVFERGRYAVRAILQFLPEFASYHIKNVIFPVSADKEYGNNSPFHW